MLKILRFILIIIAGFLFSAPGYPLSPLVQFQDLIAGEGEAGFEDGPFYSAQFNRPLGLAVDGAGVSLFVADQNNHRVRTILLNRKNNVVTLAGTGMRGKMDGPLAAASFNQPSRLALLPNDLIAVYDQGNELIRLIDPKGDRVSTLAGGGGSGQTEGDGLKIKISALWNMVYWGSENCLYFSEPDAGTLRKLNLKTRQVSLVLKSDSKIPRPGALCVVGEKLFLADRDLPQVYELQGTGNNASLKPPFLNLVGEGKKIIALAGSGKSLYAFQGDSPYPILRLYPNSSPLSFVSVWGDILKNPDPATLLPHLHGVGTGDRVGFIPDPNSEGRFFISNPFQSIVSTFRDLRMGERAHLSGDSPNSAGINDFEYPSSKPNGTFRVLLVGRSYIYTQADDHKFEKQGLEGEICDVMTTTAKRMEIALNTLASLEDAPLHYEVLNGGIHQGENELWLWPYYVVPPLAKKYDIDLTVILQDQFFVFNSCFGYPLTKEGIPGEKMDPEFALKPNSEKFKTGPLHDFFELCKSKKLIDLNSESQWSFRGLPYINELISDPEVRESLMGLMGKPIKLLQDKLMLMKGFGGKPRRLVFCYFPAAMEGPFSYRKTRNFWRDLCLRQGIPFLDLGDDFTALGLTYYPYSHLGGNAHFTVNGMSLFSTILSHELLRNNWIPFEPKKAQ